MVRSASSTVFGRFVDIDIRTAPLAQHLAEQNVEFIQFAFKWIHLLLLRVLPVDAVIRMWDSYMVSQHLHQLFAAYIVDVCLTVGRIKRL